MSKRRKTHKEKQLTDLRKKRSYETIAPSISFQIQTPSVLPHINQVRLSSNNNTALYDTSHVISHLIKTLTLVTGIIGMEIILFNLLKTNILSLPFISYR